MTSENPDKDSPLEETSKAPRPDQVQGTGFPAKGAFLSPTLRRWRRSLLGGPSKNQESQSQAHGLVDARANESPRDSFLFETARLSVAGVFDGLARKIREFQTGQLQLEMVTTDKEVEYEALEYIRFLFDEEGGHTCVPGGDEETERQILLQEKHEQLAMAQDDFVGHPGKTASIVSTDSDQVLTKPDPDSTSRPKSFNPYGPQTSFAFQLRELIKEYSERVGHPDELQQIQDVASEILYSRPSSIKILSETTSSGSWVKFLSAWCPFFLLYFKTGLLVVLVVQLELHEAILVALGSFWGFTQTVLLVCLLLELLLYPESLIGFIKNKRWQFYSIDGIRTWRFMRSSKPLLFGHVFLTWKCVCQDTRIVVVPGPFARRLVEIREATLTIPTGSSGHQSNLQAQSNRSFQPFYQQGPVPTRENAALTAPVPVAISIPVTCRHVLFMVDTDGLRLRTIESQSLSNEQLFDRMHLEYRTLKGWFRTWFGLWIFSHCDFYKFEAWTRERYCERGRGIPPASEAGYFYMPRPMDNEPPISKHEFYDRFYKRITPEQLRAVRGSFYNDHDAVDRIPQKKGLSDIVANGRPQFWGIIAREKKSGRRMLIYILISSFPGFIFFFLWLFVLDKDSLQDASTLLMISFTLLGVLYAAQLF